MEGDAGGGKSTLLSQFLGSLPDAVVLEVGGDDDETLLAYGVIDQLQPGTLTDPGTDPMAVGAWLLDLLDRRQAGGRVVVLAIDDLQWADRPSSRAVLFALRRLRADKVLAVVSARAGALADPGWARFVAGDSRVTRIRLGGLTRLISPSWRPHWDWSPVAAWGVPAGGSYRGQRALLPGVARGDRHCRTGRRGKRGLPAPRELSGGDPRPGGGARRHRSSSWRQLRCWDSTPRCRRSCRWPGCRCAGRGGRGGRRRTADRRWSGAGSGLHPSAVPGGDLRRSQSGEPARTARPGG